MNQTMLRQIAQLLEQQSPERGGRKQQLMESLLSGGATPPRSGGIGNVLQGAVKGAAAMPDFEPDFEDGKATSRSDPSLREDPFAKELNRAGLRENPFRRDEGPAFEGDKGKKPSLPPFMKWMQKLLEVNPVIGNMASAGGGGFLGKLLSKVGGGMFG